MASLAVSTPVVEVGATISLFMVGTSTAWSGATTFTVTGGTGATLTNQVVVDTTKANAVLYAGTTAGTLTISDGTNSTTITCFAAVTNERSGTGYRVPSGSLTSFRTLFAAHASNRVEVVVVGDSTTADSGASYGWPYRLRVRSIAAGITDGGRGVVETADTAARSGPTDNFSCIVSQSGFSGTPDNIDYIDQGVVYKSITNGDTVTLQGKGRYIRLFYTSYKLTGNLAYSIDGGPSTTINAYSSGSSGGNIFTRCVLLDTGDTTDGMHTITVTNTPTAISAPTIAQINSGNGTIPVGTYYYVATLTTAAGESLPSAEFSKSIPNTANDAATVVINPPFGSTGGDLTGAKIYRSSVQGGPYGLVTSGSGGTSTQYTVSDDGSISPNMAINPPTVSTAGNSTSVVGCRFLVDFLKTKGVVYHKNARSGATHGSFGLDPGVTAFNNWLVESALGLVNQTSPKTPNTRPQYRDPKLAICALGINTQQGSTPWDTGPVTRGTQNFITWAGNAGATCIIVIPHFKYSANSTYSNYYRDAMKQIATYNNVPWVDFQVPLDNIGATVNTNPHRNQTEYDAEADYLWDNVLFTFGAPKMPWYWFTGIYL